jgi:predicted phage replisome organizer
MAEAEWIKLYLKTFRTSRKISAIERMKNGDTFIVIWFKLLCLAGEINDDGAVYITSKKPFDSVSLADELKKPRAVVDAAIKVFEEHDMLFKDDAGFIQILNWEKYQNIEGLEKIRKQTRERVARCRANKSNADVTQCNATSNATGNADVTSGNAIEEEGEEQEFHSFNRSIAREEAYVENRVKQEGFEGEDAEAYRREIKEGLRRKYLGGELGQGVVLMSSEQFAYLCDYLTLDEMEKYFGIVVECEKSGKRYKKKTHYQAILEMAMKDRKVK